MSQGAHGVWVRRRPQTVRAVGVSRLAAWGWVVALGLLAGCSDPSPPQDLTTVGPSEPEPTPSRSPAAEPSESVEPVESVAPVEPPEWTPAMDEVSVEGAFAFGEYFMRLYPYVIATGDTTEWRELSHPECVFCADAAEQAEADSFGPGSPRLELTRLTGEQVDEGALLAGLRARGMGRWSIGADSVPRALGGTPSR